MRDEIQDSAQEGAFAVARALLMLARGRGTGVLDVRAASGEASISLVRGVPTAVVTRPVQDVIGAILIEQGALNEAAYRQALRDGPPTTPVGAWLVSSQSTTEGALAYALRAQLQSRVARLMLWDTPQIGFSPGLAYVGAPPVSEPLSGPDLVLKAMREALRQAGEPTVWSSGQDPQTSGPVELTAAGMALREAVSLWPEERAMFSLLETGLPPAEALVALKFAPRAVSFVRLLGALHGYRPMDPSRSLYPLLARKLGQLRRDASYESLLEVSDEADRGQLRRILRHWARSLHPDRFEGTERDSVDSGAVQSASSEVMSALTEAEDRLRTSR